MSKLMILIGQTIYYIHCSIKYELDIVNHTSSREGGQRQSYLEIPRGITKNLQVWVFFCREKQNLIQ